MMAAILDFDIAAQFLRTTLFSLHFLQDKKINQNKYATIFFSLDCSTCLVYFTKTRSFQHGCNLFKVNRWMSCSIYCRAAAKNFLLVLENLAADNGGTCDMLVLFMTEIQDDASVAGDVQKSSVEKVAVKKGERINFLWEECSCYPSQLESLGSHTGGMVNI